MGDLSRVVRSLAEDPEGAARSLGERRGALARAWLAYTQRYGARPDPGKAAATLSQAVAALTDSYAQDIAQGEDLHTDQGFLTALRLVSDLDDLAMPCFVVTRHGGAGWAAVQAIYGSSRDSAVPMPDCPEGKGLFDDPAWQAVEALLDPLMEAAYARTGTIRSAIGRSVAITRLMAATDPRQFRDDGTLAQAVAAVEAWRNPRWVGGSDWPARFRAALDAALLAWEKTLSAGAGMDTASARSAARGAAADMLGTMVPFIEDYVDLAGDTRAPDWLRGAWTWDRPAGEGAFPVLESRGGMTVEAGALCLGGAAPCRSLEAVETEDGARAALVKAARSLTPPRAPAEPLQAVTATSEVIDETFDALRLADGSVLVRSDGGPATLLTRAK